MLLALAVTVIVALTSRRVSLNVFWWDKSLGDALYAVAVYLVLAVVFPKWSIHTAGFATLLFCVGIELFQLTGIPASYARLAVVRWLIGTRFSPHDLLCYLIGSLAIASLDGLWRRTRNAYT